MSAATEVGLFDVWPARTYCGPAALAAITGAEAIPDARAWFNAVRGRPSNKPVMGAHTHELRAVLCSRGYGHVSTKIKRWDLTLQRFALEHAKPDTTYILEVTGHFVVLRNGVAVDTRTRFGAPVSLFRGRKARVREIIEILPNPQARHEAEAGHDQ